MKVVSDEEKQAHYNATTQGGFIGGIAGLSVGVLGVCLASRRYPAFRSITAAWRGYMVTSAGTFGAVKSADYASHKFEATRHPDYAYHRKLDALTEEIHAQTPLTERLVDWVVRNQYRIVFGSWITCLGTAWHIVGRNPYLTKPQKLVQARVYAQGLIVAMVVIALVLQGRIKNEVSETNEHTQQHTVDLQEQWNDMMEAEEDRLERYDATRNVHDSSPSA